jgi:hypothetical protein
MPPMTIPIVRRLRPRLGFNWLQVSWGAPEEVAARHCSYCEKLLKDEEMPLFLWNSEGWAACFCESCQAQWWTS